MNRSIITILLFLGAIGLISSFVLPKYQEGQALQQKIIQARQELQVKDEYITSLYDLSSELEKHKEEMAKIDTALPSEPSLPVLFNFFQQVSAQNGLILKNITVNVTPNSEDSEIQEIDIQLSVIGSYSSFKNFLFNLEKSARLFEVENISFSLGEEESSFNLGLKTHSY